MISGQRAATLELGFVLDARAQARAIAPPAIWNTDQGSHFTSPQVTPPLLAAGVPISMDGKGRADDNIFTERLGRSVKDEAVSLSDSANPREARYGLARYFSFSNTARPHQALAYRRPIEGYFGERASGRRPIFSAGGRAQRPWPGPLRPASRPPARTEGQTFR